MKKSTNRDLWKGKREKRGEDIRDDDVENPKNKGKNCGWLWVHQSTKCFGWTDYNVGYRL